MTTIAILGATGMLGRPVVRRLLDEGFRVRALTRNPDRARRLLPAACEFATADATDATSIQRAIQSCDALYINLSHPFSERAPDPEVAGNLAAITAAKSAGVRRVLRISAYGANIGNPWWLIDRKARGDQLLMNSGLEATIFRPSWFMESLALFLMGPTIMLTEPSATYHWIAGDDFARQVAASLHNPTAIGRIYDIQGPAPITMRDAVHGYARARSPRPSVVPLPRIARKLGRITPAMKYLDDLIAYYHRAERAFTSQPAWNDLGKPAMTIEDYAAYAKRTNDTPRK